MAPILAARPLGSRGQSRGQDFSTTLTCFQEDGDHGVDFFVDIKSPLDPSFALLGFHPKRALGFVAGPSDEEGFEELQEFG